MEVKVQLSPGQGYRLKEAARSQSMSVAQFLRLAVDLKIAADRDGVGYFDGTWVKQSRLEWKEAGSVVRK